MNTKTISDVAALAPSPAAAVQLTLVNTPDGAVLIRADGDLGAGHGAARVAATLCRFADGLFDNGQPVRMAPEVVDQVL